MTTNNLYAAHAAVLEGLGYAMLPLWLAEFDLDRGRLVQACSTWKPEPITLSHAYLPGRSRPARVAALITYLQRELSDEAGVINALRHRFQRLPAMRLSGA